jgi:aryl-alcohol dehydrogenase-like predicted oxidoreductase
MLTRTIPSSGEALPAIGLGTWSVFDVGEGERERRPLAEVVAALFAAGGRLLDSSPMYGRAETVAGDLLAERASPGAPAFLATKVWTEGREAGIVQMETSMRRLRAPRLDLIQIHNLVDWRTHARTLRAWKDAGRVRYIGITHYTPSAHAALESVLLAEPWDFVQLDYALDDRAAERRLLPLAAERGVAVLVNRPFGGGSLLSGLGGTPLPVWAAELGCTSWAQCALKFVLGHPAVTCVIPATSRVEHLRDNVAAGVGPLPDAALRLQMAKSFDRR